MGTSTGKPLGAGAPEAIPFGLEVLFADSPDFIAVTDPEGRLPYTNHPAVGSGTRWSETLFDLVLPAARDTVRQAHERVFRTGAPANLDVPARTPDGRSGWMLLTSSPIRSGERIIALLHRGTDITERRAEEERLRRAEALMVDTEGVAHIGIWEWDITQPHATWSPGLYVIYGLNPKTYVPSYEEYLKRVHPDDRQRVMDATNAVFHQHHRPRTRWRSMPPSSPAPTSSSSSSPTSRRTTCRNPCARWPASCSCWSAATRGGSTPTPTRPSASPSKA